MSDSPAPPPRTLPDLCRQHGGREDADTGAFIFDSLRLALRVACELGAQPQIPDELLDRPASLRMSRRGFVVLEMQWREGDLWPAAHRKKSKWQLCTNVLADQRPEAERMEEVDGLLRVLSADGEDGPVQIGKFMLDAGDRWVRLSDSDVYSRFCALGRKCDVDIIKGLAVANAFTRVNKPFQPEYPGNREWNFGPQLIYPPIEGAHRHWDMILNHCGQDIDEPVKQANLDGINTGAEYLLAWWATIVQSPTDRLPYLFFHGEQNGGKSIYHEAFALLTTKGVVSADRALTSDKDGELDGAVLGYIEEKNIAQAGVYNKVKELVTAPMLSIRRMYHPPYRVTNTLHLVQCSNERLSIDIDFGDTRVVMIHVGPVKDEIPKPVLLQRLREEGPAITHTLLNFKLPAPTGRLRLPAIETASKQQAAVDSLPPVAPAIAEAIEKEWTGTGKDLAEWLGCDPVDTRMLKNQLGKCEAYFKQQGIEVAWGRKIERGRLLTIRRRP